MQSPADKEPCVRRLEKLRVEATKAGGSLVVERAPREINELINGRLNERDAARLNLMSRIKERLDPRNIFWPGRFNLVMNNK